MKAWEIILVIAALGGAGFGVWWFVFRESPESVAPSPGAPPGAPAGAPPPKPRNGKGRGKKRSGGGLLDFFGFGGNEDAAIAAAGMFGGSDAAALAKLFA